MGSVYQFFPPPVRILHNPSDLVSISAQFQKPCGYRIAAIMPPCQGGDEGSTPSTRSMMKAEVKKPRLYHMFSYVGL